MYKLSYYSIVSEPLDTSAKRIIYSTRTGKMLVVSDYCYQCLSNDSIDIIPKSIQEKLIQEKLLVPKNEIEIETVIHENVDFVETDKDQLYEIIQPSAMCQLGCYYCGQQHTKDYVADDLIDKLTDRIKLKFISGNYKKIYIGWFGGEPLMGLPQMRKIYASLTAKINNTTVPIAGKVVTNGLSLKEEIYKELVRALHIDDIEVTLDGAEAYHDKHRYTKSGEGSFSIIYRNLKNILSRYDFPNKDCKIVLRCNVDEKNSDGVEPLIRKIAEDNLHKKIDNLYFASIYSWGGNDAHKKSLTKEKFSMMKMKWEILKIRLGYHYKPELYKRKMNTCVATGGDTELYDAFGNVYNCTEIPYSDFYKNSNYKLGNLKGDHLEMFENKPLNDWYDVVKDTSRYPCHSCKLLPVCGGSCPKSWLEGNPACPPFKFSILKEMQLKYLLNKTPAHDLEQVLLQFENSLEEHEFQRYGA